MFKCDTLKTKTFWLGLGQIVVGAILCKVGMAEVGAPLIGTGITAVGVRDAITKLQA